MRVLAFAKYGTRAASTRQRFVQYEPALAEAGISVEYAPLLDNDHMERLVRGRRASIHRAAFSYVRRIARLLDARRYDALWIYCELFPYLPGMMERLAGLTNKPIIYDFDDAIFHMYDEAARPLVRRFLDGKLEPLLRRASICCCGNPYLRDYAARFCPQSVILPTVVDTTKYRPSNHRVDDPPVIGWIGSPTTWRNVRPLLPMLAELARERGVIIRAIGAGEAALEDSGPGLQFVGWSEETEVEEVRKMDIGIMPLNDLPFERGKSGYKLIQYMACGLPVVASPVGVNSVIVRQGENGFLAASEQEWRDLLVKLIDDPALRLRMGAAGRQRVQEEYSLSVTAPRLVALMRELVR